jgi:N-acetylglucosamine kinase-like BadF-type ATPase
MAYFLGIDGGGTKTECVVADEHQALGRGLSGTAKRSRVSEDDARQNLRAAIEQACSGAGIPSSQLARSCYGLSGAADPHAAENARRLLASLVGGEVEIATDVAIALEAAFPGDSGAIVIAGTGSIAYGRNERGEVVRAGGWGPLVSDEGSGEWIGRAAVAFALRAHDAGETTSFLPAIMNTWHLATYEDVVRFVGSQPPPDFAALFPHVAEHAERDDLARGILLRAAGELAEICHIVLRRLWPHEKASAEVAMCGGVFRNSALVRQAFTDVVRSRRPHVRVALCEREPVEGALALARRAAQRQSSIFG